MPPIRRQYLSIKRKYPQAIVLFRLGDFYETFDDDAKIASRELDIVLTSREMGKGHRVPMAGIPYHAVDDYLARLIKRGYKVAICEQVTKPGQTKGLVQREVFEGRETLAGEAEHTEETIVAWQEPERRCFRNADVILYLWSDPSPRVMATNALDNISEVLVQNAIDRISKDHTVIIIAHRLSTIVNADRILVLANGQVAEEGTHKELIEKRGVYWELYNKEQVES